MVAMALLVIVPSQVIWSYFSFGLVLAIGLVAMFLRADWQKARGLDKVLLFGPLFYAVPLAAFGTEHFTLTEGIASLIPAWIPWPLVWTHFVGACFIAAALCLVTRIQARLSAGLLALTFFLFVVLMDAPGWAHNPQDRFALALALRELSFSGGALALAASLSEQRRERGTHILATVARYFVAIPVLFYSFEQFMHGDPAVGLWTCYLDVPGRRGLRSRGHPVACWQEDPGSSDVAGLDRAYRGVVRLRADSSRGTRQPRKPQLYGGYTDVLRRRSSAGGRPAA